MKTIEIKNIFNDETIHSGTFENIKECVEDAVRRRISLREADLSETNLYRADLREANLSEANLYGANLKEANLREANLSRANLSEANLYRASLREANLYKVSLSEANLYGANLSGADLYEADLSGADLSETNLYGANLYGATNYYSFVAYDTSKRLIHCVRHQDTWMIQAGCFWGTLNELEAEVKAAHNSKVYLANIEILKEL